MMMAGATAVQIGSAVLSDPLIFDHIAADLYSPDGELPMDIVGCAHV